MNGGFGSARIWPSILSTNHGRIWSDLLPLLSEAPSIGWLHFDVMDGAFVPNLSFGPQLLSDLRSLALDAGIALPRIQVHLMVERPMNLLERFMNLGAAMVTVHLECGSQTGPALNLLRKRKILAGLALNPETDVAEATPFLSSIDSLLLMGVHPGFGGQGLLPTTAEKIRRAVDLRRRIGHNYSVVVDGGMDGKTIGEAAAAGCDFAVAGSAIFRSPRAIDSLNELQRQFLSNAKPSREV